jgi:L-alanine-DL-glutamate epimerase-like enolase superfamily enzyme
VVERTVILEWDAMENPMRDRLLVEGPQIVKGMISVSEKPGLGVAEDRRAISDFWVD